MSNVVKIDKNKYAAACESPQDFVEDLCKDWKTLLDDPTNGENHVDILNTLSLAAIYFYNNPEVLEELTLLAAIGSLFAESITKTGNAVTDVEENAENRPSAEVIQMSSVFPAPKNIQ